MFFLQVKTFLVARKGMLAGGGSPPTFGGWQRPYFSAIISIPHNTGGFPETGWSVSSTVVQGVMPLTFLASALCGAFEVGGIETECSNHAVAGPIVVADDPLGIAADLVFVLFDVSPFEEIETMSSCTAVVLAISLVAGQAKPGATEGVPPKVLKQFDALVGDWKIESTAGGGMSGKSSFTCSWAPGKHMLMWHLEWDLDETTVRGSGIFGWDALEEQVHMSEFWETGSYHHRHFKIESEKLWVGHEFSGASLDGKPMSQKISLEIVGPNKFIIKTWDVVIDGEKTEGSSTFTFTRKQK